jgi:hypothetical protein
MIQVMIQIERLADVGSTATVAPDRPTTAYDESALAIVFGVILGAVLLFYRSIGRPAEYEVTY